MASMEPAPAGSAPIAYDDAEAIRSSLEDPHAFTAIFDRHFDGVHAFASRRVGSDLGDEITAETFARAFDRRSRYDLTVLDARPWLLGIAANLLRRHWRSERRRLAAYARHGAPTPQGIALQFERGGELAAALNSLRKGERDVVFLHALADLSYEEIALALDVPIGTVRSRLSRARERLRNALSLDPIAIEESDDA